MMLNIADLSKVLGIGQHVILALVKLGRIPYKYIISAGGEILQFCPDAIKQYLKANPELIIDDEYLETLRQTLMAECPQGMNAVREFGNKIPGKKTFKYYYLIPHQSKKLGLIYYIRYLENGRLVPSKWSSGTNDAKVAEAWAIENRERLISEYYQKKAKKPVNLYKILTEYYEEDSPYLIVDAKRGRTLGDRRRKMNDAFVKKRFIPFLKKNHIRGSEDIDTALLARFQNELLKNVKAQTVNGYIAGIKMIFRHLITTGYAQNNPCGGLPRIRVRKEDVQATGCYELDMLKGIFNKEWKNPRHYILCLLIYATGMRNSEINRIQMCDIIEIDGEKFIDIPKSKTVNGERVVPLHPFVYKAIMDYAGEKADFIFPQSPNSFDDLCARANLSLAGHTGYTVEMLKKENIVFYSGRHFWKTLMRREGLGKNIEEVFMGHKVSANVAERYTRRDKWGRQKLVQKAQDVFTALARCLFE